MKQPGHKETPEQEPKVPEPDPDFPLENEYPLLPGYDDNEKIIEELINRDLVSKEVIEEIKRDLIPDTKEVTKNGKRYHFEWNEESIQITQCCDVKGEEEEDHDNCQLETYDFARIE